MAIKTHCHIAVDCIITEQNTCMYGNIILNVYKLCCIVILSKHFSPVTSLMYEKLSNSTLDELAEYFQELPDLCNCPEDYDIQYGVSYVHLHV